MEYRTAPLPIGTRAQTAATLEAMRAVAWEAATRPRVLTVATRLVREVDGRNVAGLARRVRQWMRHRVRFLPDPAVPGTELIRTPDYLLEEIDRFGFARGDCDDAATLAAALLLSAGVTGRFVAVGWGGEFAHVYAEAATPAGFLELDVTEPVRMLDFDVRMTLDF
jgi:transglutaminase-like putative cysteine protease